MRAEANVNPNLMARYLQIRDHIASIGPHQETQLVTSDPAAGLQAMDPSWGRRPGSNEWYLFHGTSRQAAEAICSENFVIDRIGSGAASTVMGGASHRPLYGNGFYFAERSTKGDEYATSPAGHNQYTMLLCRVVGGKAFTCQEDGMKDDQVDREVILGPHHSIIGDRETRLGKPFKEIVVYSVNQVYPEFILTYARQ